MHEHNRMYVCGSPAVNATQCVSSMPPLDDPVKSVRERRADPQEGLALIFSNYTFECDGLLDHWGIVLGIHRAADCEVILDFHILRPTEEDNNLCGLVSVGKSRTTIKQTRRGTHSRTVFNWTVTDSVRVSTGDKMGLAVSLMRCSRRRPWVNIVVSEEPSDPSLTYSTRRFSEEELENVFSYGCRDSSDGTARDDDDDTTERSTSDTPRTRSEESTPRPGISTVNTVCVHNNNMKTENRTREKARTKRVPSVLWGTAHNCRCRYIIHYNTTLCVCGDYAGKSYHRA